MQKFVKYQVQTISHVKNVLTLSAKAGLNQKTMISSH